MSDLDTNCTNTHLQAICDIVSRAAEERRNNGKEPRTIAKCRRDDQGEFLSVKHQIAIDLLDIEPITVEFIIRVDSINLTATYSGYAGYAIAVKDVEDFHSKMLISLQLVHSSNTTYNWVFTIDPHREDLQILKDIQVGTEIDLFFSRRDDNIPAQPGVFANRFLSALIDLEPAYNLALMEHYQS